MEPFIPFNGNVFQLYQNYGHRCFIGRLMYTAGGIGVAGYASTDGAGNYFFRAGGEQWDDVAEVGLKGFVIP